MCVRDIRKDIIPVCTRYMLPYPHSLYRYRVHIRMPRQIFYRLTLNFLLLMFKKYIPKSVSTNSITAEQIDNAVIVDNLDELIENSTPSDKYEFVDKTKEYLAKYGKIARVEITKEQNPETLKFRNNALVSFEKLTKPVYMNIYGVKSADGKIKTLPACVYDNETDIKKMKIGFCKQGAEFVTDCKLDGATPKKYVRQYLNLTAVVTV